MSKARILVVDDEASMRTLMEYTLGQAGYEVLTAETGTEGLARSQTDRPDLIVADVYLPDLHGHDLYRRLRANPALQDVPFVFLSARGQLVEQIEGLGLGADDYVPKPFERRELLARLEHVLQRAALYHQLTLIDRLTRLGNRRYLEQRLDEELARPPAEVGSLVSGLVGSAEIRQLGNWAIKPVAQLPSCPPTNLALLLLAIDSLARLRAEQGPAAAEFVLCSVAGLLRRAVRSRDVAARYEEDTFAILMPGTDWDNARAASRRLQALLQQSTFMYGEQELQVRTRFGLSHTATADARRPALLAAAQRGLEEAGSEEGGLRVEMVDSPWAEVTSDE